MHTMLLANLEVPRQPMFVSSLLLYYSYYEKKMKGKKKSTNCTFNDGQKTVKFGKEAKHFKKVKYLWMLFKLTKEVEDCEVYLNGIEFKGKESQS